MNFTAKEISDIINGEIIGNSDVEVNSVSKIEDGKSGDLCFLSNPKYASYIYSSSASIIIEKPIKDEIFDRWLDTLIILKGPDILRVKGIVFLDGMETPFVFHGVQHIFDPPVKMDNWIGTDRRTRIVVIARNLETLDLERSFDMLR